MRSPRLIIILCLLGYAVISLVFRTSPSVAAAQSISSINNTSLPPYQSSIDPLGQLGGEPSSVLVHGSYVYLEMGQRLVVLDATNPASPQIVGRSPTLGYGAVPVGIANDHLYLVESETWYAKSNFAQRLHIFDITNPAAPVQVGIFNSLPAIHGIYFEGNLLFITQGNTGNPSNPPAGLYLFDLTNPALPQQIAFYDLWHPSGLDIQGNYAYVGDIDGLHILDISTPEKPTEVGFYDTGSASVGEVVIEGHYVYIHLLGRMQLGPIVILDVSNPSSPTYASDFSSGYTARPTIQGNYAYVVNQGGGFAVYDISNPSTPIEVGTVSEQFQDELLFTGKITFVGSFAYIAGGNRLAVYDVSNPVNPQKVDTHQFLGATRRLSISGTTAYVADTLGDLYLVDISDPEQYKILSFYDMPGRVASITVEGDYAYIAEGEVWSETTGYVGGGLRTLNVSNPAAPYQVAYYDIDGSGIDVEIVGNYIYLTGNVFYQQVLHVLDISNPSAPTFLLSQQGGGSIAKTNGYAYVASNEGLRIVNISNPAAPVEEAVFTTPGSISSVKVAGDYAYISTSELGVRVLDIKNPSTPTPVAAFGPPNHTFRLAINGNYAYLINLYGGGPGALSIFDVSNPTTPIELLVSPGAQGYDVAVAGENVYLTGTNGLVALRYVGFRIYLPFTQHQASN